MFESLITQYFLQPRVVHRLPGRLRVHIPALLHVTENREQFEELLTRLFQLPDGIETVQARCLTGNVLFTYTEEEISEKEILRWIQQIGKVVVRERNRLLNTPMEKMPVVIDRIVEIFRESMRYRLDLSKEVVIPNDVWFQ